MEAMLTILPYFCAFIWGITARQHKKTPFKFTSTTLSHISSVISAPLHCLVIPALFTSMSTLPNLETTSLTAFSISDTFVTSTLSARAVPPDFTISLATSLASAGMTSKMATLAPSSAKRKQMPCPMPLPPPVTITTLSSNRFSHILIFLPLFLKPQVVGNPLHCLKPHGNEFIQCQADVSARCNLLPARPCGEAPLTE